MLNILKNDTIIVIKGKEKGKKGKVLKVFPEKGKIIVEGLNLIKKHTKKRRQQDQAGIIEKEGPISISNVAVNCSKCKKGVRIGIKRENKKLVRFCRTCNQGF
ncbi:MAG: 50S ribosomal protein L24 [Candidatus Kappaea frigidicola]|nr:50S ribosomal protein L24 [Candidatus Kappaea frigidicola]